VVFCEGRLWRRFFDLKTKPLSKAKSAGYRPAKMFADHVLSIHKNTYDVKDTVK
jgi:hypothetical protein